MLNHLDSSIDIMNELIESYLNGNISWVKDQLKINNISISEFLEFYNNSCGCGINEAILIVRRLES